MARSKQCRLGTLPLCRLRSHCPNLSCQVLPSHEMIAKSEYDEETEGHANAATDPRKTPLPKPTVKLKAPEEPHPPLATPPKPNVKLKASTNQASSSNFFQTISTRFNVNLQSLSRSGLIFIQIIIDCIILLYYALPGIALYLMMKFARASQLVHFVDRHPSSSCSRAAQY